MIKRRIKIVILFIIVLALFVGGWYMYKRLEYNRLSFSENIYDYVSSDAIEVININREYNLDELLVYNNSLRELTDVLGQKKTVPIIISRYKNNNVALIAKVNLDQQVTIKKYIENYIALPFSVKINYYKGNDILIYTMPDDSFMACTFFKGIFVVSKSYRLVCNIIDSDLKNSFFYKSGDKEVIMKMLERVPVSLYVKAQKGILALDYAVRSDTIKMNGYLFGYDIQDSTALKNRFTPYIIDYPDNICVEDYSIQTGVNPSSVKIILNKTN